ncbi:hypothetical protein PTSG_12428 [Salpingoeca rosetta]|uniref:Maf-like protein n=1 Tax=Salpingoeca rosetta (strain ATCC 50818 / BSB-021) TaxID=946362 RepID=F2UCK5_SALR5|nr:uncharacterized protein PTSG_12428 [Salpingoeca rosetta]EGD74312.1 hypothetical protein PTSG_12428 [Salpingoeca rosetta]|eukprot:XP_004993212.1 hypothetical protein PTSG_12428 [Salpingoeca rosetta]
MSVASVLVLGSSSKWRRQQLEEQGYTFEAMAADIDERAVTVDGDEDGRGVSDPSKLTLAIANAKADALVPKCPPNSFLITSDQVVHYKGTIREKPETPEMCKEYLRSYETVPATTVTAVVVTNVATGERFQQVDIASQQFKPIPEAVMDEVIEGGKGDVMYCCGGFMIDHPKLQPYLGERKGSEDSILGMPLAVLESLLDKAGYKKE